MIYALAELWKDAEEVLEYEDKEDAWFGFRTMCVGASRRVLGITTMWLFATRETAERAIIPDRYEINVDETTAVRVLEWESAFGKHGFSERAPEVVS